MSPLRLCKHSRVEDHTVVLYQFTLQTMHHGMIHAEIHAGNRRNARESLFRWLNGMNEVTHHRLMWFRMDDGIEGDANPERTITRTGAGVYLAGVQLWDVFGLDPAFSFRDPV